MNKVSIIIGIMSILTLCGCTVRSYTVMKERVDQDTSAGNRGYFLGTPPEAEERKLTRPMRMVEVELRAPVKFEKMPIEKERMAPMGFVETSGDFSEAVEDSPAIEMPQDSMETTVNRYKKYTVQKGDTLQKISQKLFGTTKKWHKIYNVNQDTLKGPNKIFPGQVINIPTE
ncbi:MAG: LysM peptidoglycan-binding domain-containing protein [Candidatus Omnitrophica bacterium]|nr:LysM peptidoglycan-binding domain-containing protein [Candidatus Omnitrophota bacterium]